MSRPMIALTISIPAPMLDGLGRMARERGLKKELLASELLGAAYTARLKPVGDAALEAAVAQIGEAGAGGAARVLELESKAANLRAELNNVNASLDASRRNSAAQIAKVGELQKLLWAAQEEIDGLKGALDAAQQELETLKAPAPLIPTVVTINAASDIDPETRDALADLADCTRRMILALKASGLTPKEIARETDTPVATVQTVLAQHAAKKHEKKEANHG